MSDNWNRSVHISSHRHSSPNSRQPDIHRNRVSPTYHRRENERHRARSGDASPNLLGEDEDRLRKRLRDANQAPKVPNVVKLRRPANPKNSSLSTVDESLSSLTLKRPRQDSSKLALESVSGDVNNAVSSKAQHVSSDRPDHKTTLTTTLKKKVPKDRSRNTSPHASLPKNAGNRRQNRDDVEEGEITDDRVASRTKANTDTNKGYSKWASPPPPRYRRRSGASNDSSASNSPRHVRHRLNNRESGSGGRSDERADKTLQQRSPRRNQPPSNPDKDRRQHLPVQNRPRPHISTEHAREVVELESSSGSDEDDEMQDSLKKLHAETDSTPTKSIHVITQSEQRPTKTAVSAADTFTDAAGGGSSSTSSSVREDNKRLPVYYPAIQGCRTVRDFKVLNKIEEGTYGIVFRACERKTGEVIALKRLKMEREKDGFPITSLREVCCLLKAQHRNIVRVREIVVGDNMEQIFMVMDFVEHDLKTLMNSMSEPFQVGEVKTLMRQLLEAVAFLHENWIIHRDLKTSNLLLSNKGVLKVADFGLAREYGSPIKPYTSVVVTLWYRAPELILGSPTYSAPIDIWSCGCIFAELMTMEPLFPGKTEIDELMLIYKLLGTPNEKLWPGYSDLPLAKKVTFATFPVSNLRRRFSTFLTPLGITFLNKFLVYDPTKRITAADALREALQRQYVGHAADGYFYESPAMVPEEMFPTWPAKSELTAAASAAVAAAAAAATTTTATAVQRAAVAAAAIKQGAGQFDGKKAKTDKALADADPKKWVEKYGVKVSANAAKAADAGFKLKF